MATQFSYTDYTVGWVCALPLERAVAEGLLDIEHESLPRDDDDNDPNIYTLGRIGVHNVVIACLPAGQTGVGAAATVAAQMRSKFTAIRFGLMVGIGGGVPTPRTDIRLGDVVISQPSDSHSGVVQYDIGRRKPSGFERTGSLNTPPAILLNALGKLQSNHLRNKNNMLTYLSSFDSIPEFARPQEEDILFRSSYDHIENTPTCNLCNKDEIVSRPSRAKQIVIHYGTIASGNIVLKDARTRDTLSTELGGVLCFETEAAGLMNNFPCLIIRGICNYSDTHKNDIWQKYAASVAAACAKEILSVVHAVRRTLLFDEAPKLPERLRSLRGKTITEEAGEFPDPDYSKLYSASDTFISFDRFPSSEVFPNMLQGAPILPAKFHDES